MPPNSPKGEEHSAAEFFDGIVVEFVVERQVVEICAWRRHTRTSASNTTLCAKPLRLNNGSRMAGSAAQNGMLARTPVFT